MDANEQIASRPLYLMLLTTCAFYATGDWATALPFVSILAAGILYERILNHWFFWTLVTCLLGSAIGRLWLSEGNHLFLLFYLSLTALIASHTSTPRVVFKWNARLIIGLVFTLAIFWKLISESYLSGQFYTYLLVIDDRLGAIGLLFTELTRQDIAINRQAVAGVLDAPVQLITYPKIRILAMIMTWLTFIIEAALAVVFLIDTTSIQRLRSPLLLIFLVGTYTVVPVPAFGMALACLGYAETSSKTYQNLFLAAFIIMPLTALRYYLLPI